ncbi:MAG: ATP-binding protein [Rhodobacterales bacterium]
MPETLTEITDWMVRVGARPEAITNVQIVLAEALNNIVEHGFKHKKPGYVDINIDLSEAAIVVGLTDDGVAFTPPEVEQSPLRDKNDLDNLPEGGFGWFLIRKITSSCERDGRKISDQLLRWID